MARTRFVDCVSRHPWHSMEAFLQEVRASFRGATVVVVKTDDSRTASLVQDWSRAHATPVTVDRIGELWWVRIVLLPDEFGALPRAVHLARLVPQASQALELAVSA